MAISFRATQTHRFVHFSNGHGVQRAITTDVHARLRAHFSDDLVGNKSAGGRRKTHARQKERERGRKRRRKKGLLSPLSKPRRQQRLFNDKDKQKRILFLMTELERGNSLNHFSFLLAPFSLLLINLIVQRIPFSFFPRIINLQQQLNCP